MYLSRAEVRALDERAVRELGIPSLLLMENAGRGAAQLLQSLGVRGPVAVCCGKGNNGGDGFVMARRLALDGAAVRVLLFCPAEALEGDAAANYRLLGPLGVPVTVFAGRSLDAGLVRKQLAAAEWVVDAMVGTGLTGPVREPLNQAIAAINAAPAKVLAVDLPSGLDCDTGQPLGPTVRAAHTATFAALKKGFANPAARSWSGRVHLLDIGIPSMPSLSVPAHHAAGQTT